MIWHKTYKQEKRSRWKLKNFKMYDLGRWVVLPKPWAKKLLLFWYLSIKDRSLQAISFWNFMHISIFYFIAWNNTPKLPKARRPSLNNLTCQKNTTLFNPFSSFLFFFLVFFSRKKNYSESVTMLLALNNH